MTPEERIYQLEHANDLLNRSVAGVYRLLDRVIEERDEARLDLWALALALRPLLSLEPTTPDELIADVMYAGDVLHEVSE